MIWHSTRTACVGITFSFLLFQHHSHGFLPPLSSIPARLDSATVGARGPRRTAAASAAVADTTEYLSPAQERLAKRTDGRDRSGSFAVVELSGHQHWVEVGRFYNVYRLQADEGRRVALNRVLVYNTPEGEAWFGTPYLENVRVYATVQEHFRGPKLKIFKFRPKKHYRRMQGHRQEMTRIKIDRIEIVRSADAVDTPRFPDYDPDMIDRATEDPLYNLFHGIREEAELLRLGSGSPRRGAELLIDKFHANQRTKVPFAYKNNF
ncbi:unnamed protein product [Vitrella brassicaformis CCMP3155]|uniref:Ribosomal protein L21 n=2 Tax=Vitrella brassicaformis TaxID=1169539 RepID=A0A0G4F4J7_VITBC|nr:unnamed protein product [Vitrella brassicaformis CCMP3155]|eukprot:CEM06836.1 unnamed protein product [Vitrella brassicaformis CCMP3155]